VEVVVPVASEVRAGDEVHVYSLQGGRMVRLMHKGPYEDSARSYRRILTWIAENGLQITGPIREIYHNNPQEVSSEEILTEIQVPVG
jgi:AraC family transcriptional regulator